MATFKKCEVCGGTGLQASQTCMMCGGKGEVQTFPAPTAEDRGQSVAKKVKKGFVRKLKNINLDRNAGRGRIFVLEVIGPDGLRYLATTTGEPGSTVVLCVPAPMRLMSPWLFEPEILAYVGDLEDKLLLAKESAA